MVVSRSDRFTPDTTFGYQRDYRDPSWIDNRELLVFNYGLGVEQAAFFAPKPAATPASASGSATPTSRRSATASSRATPACWWSAPAAGSTSTTSRSTGSRRTRRRRRRARLHLPLGRRLHGLRRPDLLAARQRDRVRPGRARQARRRRLRVERSATAARARRSGSPAARSILIGARAGGAPARTLGSPTTVAVVVRDRATAIRLREQEEADHQADHAGDHEDQTDGLDLDPGDGDVDCVPEDRANRDQEYRCSDCHGVIVPAPGRAQTTTLVQAPPARAGAKSAGNRSQSCPQRAAGPRRAGSRPGPRPWRSRAAPRRPSPPGRSPRRPVTWRS